MTPLPSSVDMPITVRYHNGIVIQIGFATIAVAMFSRILTNEERGLIGKWLKADGEKEMHIRVIATRARKFVPQIEADLALVRKLLERYDRARS
jgi:hypothetical protein